MVVLGVPLHSIYCLCCFLTVLTMSGDRSAAGQPPGDRFANMDDVKPIVEGFNEVLEHIHTDLQELKEMHNNFVTTPVVGENTTVQHELDEIDAEMAA